MKIPFSSGLVTSEGTFYSSGVWKSTRIVRAIRSSGKHSNATFLHFPEDAPGGHLYFLAESYNAHFFAFLCGFVPAVFLVCFPCLNPFSLCVFFVFPPPSSCSLLPPALSHSPGTSLLPYCISLRFSEHHLSHCPQYAVNGALGDSDFLIMEDNINIS